MPIAGPIAQLITRPIAALATALRWIAGGAPALVDCSWGASTGVLWAERQHWLVVGGVQAPI